MISINTTSKHVARDRSHRRYEKTTGKELDAASLCSPSHFFRSFAGTIQSLSGLLSLRLVHRGTPQPCRRTKHHRRSSERRQPEFTKEPNSFFLLFRSLSTPSETSRKTQDLAGDIFYSLSFRLITFDRPLGFPIFTRALLQEIATQSMMRKSRFEEMNRMA
ncbi:hypothetical protein HanXRQr2_Chr09g0370701 [Helianthus annuus]|uniref:Uncharacterized protein n=1 Tax=Helianthus annuus TaxID=4232 RepID=A0A9K3N760_HELAN|nr:uncharacterized protein LOC110874233 [Helianthus annuus]KAF5789394.1 hypothetical protein HanXRQr2_Chr09g0370701 [Helianthus annuus]KAJ0891699.1 hypothetical protein HanPSC8_Chr09g0357111 [Helianthus annuus]